MSFFKNEKKNTAPHKWYPDILHWKKGDEVFCWNIVYASGKIFSADYHRYVNEAGRAKATFYYEGISSNGNIILKDKEDHFVEFEFYRFIKKARNESLKNRNLSQKIQESSEYMELIEAFQKAFEELEESDKNYRLSD